MNSNKKAKSIILEKFMPALGTTSLMAILDIYENVKEIDRILLLDTKAIILLDSESIYANNDYGFYISKDKNIKFSWNYRRDFNIKNLITKENLETFRENLKQSGIVDASVSQLRVVIKDEKLGRKFPEFTTEDTFIMRLIANPADSNLDRRLVKSKPINKRLVEELKFKYMVMNLYEFMEYSEYLSEKKTDWEFLIYRNPKNRTMTGIITKPTLARHMYKSYFGKFGILKGYVPGRRNIIMLKSAIGV